MSAEKLSFDSIEWKESFDDESCCQSQDEQVKKGHS